MFCLRYCAFETQETVMEIPEEKEDYLYFLQENKNKV